MYWISPDLPENCHLNVKNCPKNDNFWQFFWKKFQVFSNFWHSNVNFAEGQDLTFSYYLTRPLSIQYSIYIYLYTRLCIIIRPTYIFFFSTNLIYLLINWKGKNIMSIKYNNKNLPSTICYTILLFINHCEKKNFWGIT